MILSRSVIYRIISGNTEIRLPAPSPDKAPCDFCLWGICEAEIRTIKPKTLEDLMEVVNEFVASLDAPPYRPGKNGFIKEQNIRGSGPVR